MGPSVRRLGSLSAYHLKEPVIFINDHFPPSFFSTPTGVETPDVIDLRKQQRKDPERPLYQVSHNYLILVLFWSVCAKVLILFLIPVLLIPLFLHFLVFNRYLKKRKKRLLRGPYLELHTRMHFSVLINYSEFSI